MSLKITIDAAPVLMRSAGVKNYLYHWMTSLRRRASAGEEIQAFPLLADLGTLHHDASDFPIWSTVLRLGAMHAASRLGPGTVGLLAGRTDVFHASNQVHCGPSGARLTATIHDVTSRLMPELHTSGNIEADRRFVERILRQADALIAVSENTRLDAIRWWGLPEDRIRTIYSGVPEEYFNAQPAQRQRPYVLCVGTIEPRKNLGTLLDAWSLLRPELRHEFDLVFAGPAAWGEKNTFNRIRAEATYLGYVPEAELPGLTAGAAIFAYPSLYEGFGFPVVQAMAAGTPVLTSNTSCLPEITDGAALLVDPRSPAEIAAGLTKLLESETLRRELSAQGRARAAVFRWARCAEESLEFFRTVAGK